MEENNETAVSMQNKLQSSQDPGWNDPPAWALSVHKSNNNTPTKKLMNKRLAFPLYSKPMETRMQSDPASQSMPLMPPMMNMPPSVNITSLTTAPHKPVVTPTKAKIHDTVEDIEINKEEALISTLDNLHHLIEQLVSCNKGEIKKRLDRMGTMWREDKLNKVVHQGLLRISIALKEGDVEKADQLHVSLMLNNATICSSWMPGIRQIIIEMKNKKL